MNKREFLAGMSALCLMAGCSSTADGDPAAAKVHTAQAPGSGASPLQSEPVTGTLIDGTVSGAFPLTDTGECTPFGMPITFFLTGAFGPDALVSETARPVSASQCLREQVLEAPVDAWAALAHTTICGGNDDTSLCGAQAIRLCSVNLLTKWAAERTESVSVSDFVFGFKYVLAPQGEAARTALYERALREANNLLNDSLAIIADYSAGTRRCPDENYDEILATATHAVELRQEISAHLNGA